MSYNPKKPKPLHEQTTFYKTNYSIKQRVQITFPEDSPYTKQSFKDECDINKLMARYQATGELPVINERAPMYLDVTGIDFQESMNFISGAQTLFNELPSGVRARFHNDPAQFLDFTSDPKNHEELAKMGLLRPQSEWVDPNMYVKKPEPIVAAPAPAEPPKKSPAPPEEKPA